MSIWAGIFAPRGTPQPIVAKLNSALDKALDDASVRKRIADLGGSMPEKKERSPSAFDAYVKAEAARWAPILKAASQPAKYELLSRNRSAEPEREVEPRYFSMG